MRVTYPTYYDESIDSDYPFESGVSRSNGEVEIEQGVFVDARLFVPDGRHDVFLSSVEVGDTVKLTLSDGNGVLGTGSFTRNAPPDYLNFYDTNSVFLGLLQSPSEGGMRKLAGWEDGTYNFTITQTRFATTVVVPQPQKGVRSIRLETGEVFSGDVTLVGEKGVQLTMERFFASSSSRGDNSSFYDNEVIRVDVVGDPLYLRRECKEQGLDNARDKVIKGVVFENNVILPDATGGFIMTLATSGGADAPAIRITPERGGIRIGFIGD